jgi:quercetin dioxygenase-like cupin family protein
MSMNTDYTYVNDLIKELEIPRAGILSRILLKNDQVNVTLFGFDSGQDLSEHTAVSPAIIQILQGEAALTIAGEEQVGGPGTWIYMPARTPHSLLANTPVVMLLILLKSSAG